MKFSNFNSEAKRTSYRHGNLFEEGSYVQYQDKVGKVHRRGPNYVIAITDKYGNKLRIERTQEQFVRLFEHLVEEQNEKFLMTPFPPSMIQNSNTLTDHKDEL